MELYIDDENNVMILGYSNEYFTSEEIEKKVIDLCIVYHHYEVIALPVSNVIKI